MFPVLFDLGQFKIYSYPLFMSFGMGSAFIAAQSISFQYAIDKVNIRLFYSIFLSVLLLFQIMLKQFSITLWFLHGSFSTGIIFLILSLIFSKVKNIRSIDFLNCNTLPLLIAMLFAKMGCLFAGCCYGLPTDLPWGIYLHGANRHPVQIYQIIFLVLLIVIYKISFKSKKSRQFGFVYIFGIVYPVFRFFEEFLRDSVKTIYGYYHTAQFIYLSVIIVSAGIIVYSIRYNESSIGLEGSCN